MLDKLDTQDWFGVAPYCAGGPPAIVLAVNLYKSTMTAVSESLWPIAAFVAFLGVVGMMSVEIGTYRMLARAIADKEKKAAQLAGLGAVLVTGMIMYSVYSGTNTKALISSTAIMLLGYLGLMIREYLERAKDNNQAQAERVAQDEIVKTQNQIDLLKAQAELESQRRLIALAEVRKAKAMAGQVSTGQRPVSTGQSGQPALDPAVIEIAREYFAAHPGASARDWLRDPKCPIKSPTTASRYKAAV